MPYNCAMSAPILATKLYMPALRAEVVSRPRLIERLDAGLDGKLTLVSAAAGFGKTTLVSAWIAALHASAHPGRDTVRPACGGWSRRLPFAHQERGQGWE